MALQTIPITTAVNQTFVVSLSVNGGIVTLQVSLRYNEMASYWVMTVADNKGNVLLDSRPLTTGTYPAANILGQHEYLGIGACYIINASGTTESDYPNSSNLGGDFQILWGDNPSYIGYQAA